MHLLLPAPAPSPAILTHGCKLHTSCHYYRCHFLYHRHLSNACWLESFYCRFLRTLPCLSSLTPAHSHSRAHSPACADAWKSAGEWKKTMRLSRLLTSPLVHLQSQYLFTISLPTIYAIALKPDHWNLIVHSKQSRLHLYHWPWLSPTQWSSTRMNGHHTYHTEWLVWPFAKLPNSMIYSVTLSLWLYL